MRLSGLVQVSFSLAVNLRRRANTIQDGNEQTATFLTRGYVEARVPLSD
jgi:hypothetical protein